MARPAAAQTSHSAAERVRPSTGRPIDLVHLANQTFGDRLLEREILALFCVQLSTLRARMEIAGPAERLSLAHALKGSSRNVGAFVLAERAETVELLPLHEPAMTALLEELDEVRAFADRLAH
ncbi:Hpt domain-containing protein [Aurantimonas sp. Leaf443]|uniref:Hpt domain-containing protein n=1 Tax=Aurantimonas sp. Leaf443 TaxID=1736378 RepID=UPI0006F22647|nr:Hpt domain-containing protein [Aurantimonas sp. Leaf443]KQT86229.1 hypothetical protein ASG48_06585 [Aurantimonas sp. Leaf443]